MSAFAKTLANRVEGYIALRRSLGYAFQKQAAILRALARYAEAGQLDGPLTREMAINFIFSWEGTANGRAIHYGIIRRFCEYLAIYDAQTEALEPRELPRSRAIPPPRILSDEELGSLISATSRVSPRYPQRGLTLTMLVGLLASTGLRSGERAPPRSRRCQSHRRRPAHPEDQVPQGSPGPVHITTLAALRTYARHRDAAFPAPKDSAFFLSSRGNRLSPTGLSVAFGAACKLAALDSDKPLRPHDLRHRFAVTRLAAWHRDKADVQALLPLLATYLGHARYTDTAYYVTGTAELLGMAADRAFADGGVS
jgi:integrase